MSFPHPFDENRRVGVKELKEILGEKIDEATAISKSAEKTGSLNSEQQKRWDGLMDEETGEVSVVRAALAAAMKRENEEKNLAMLKMMRQGSGGSGLIDDGSRNPLLGSDAPRFRCMTSGKVIRALNHSERIGQAASDDPLTGEPGASVGAIVHSLVTGRFDYASQQQVYAATGGVGSEGGYTLNPTLSTQVIDLARSASVAMKAGALTVPMDSAELIIARLTGDPTGYWRAEGVDITASDVSFDRITLRPKTLAAIVPITIELLEDSANAAMVIEDALREALALALDQAALLGSGAESKPRGIRKQSNVNEVTGVGTPTDYAEVSDAVGDIFNANYAGEPSKLAWIMHPRDAKTYDGLTDSTGQPLQPTPWAAAVRRLTTTSLPSTEGGGSNESASLVGDFSQCIIGVRTSGAVIQILDSGQVTDGSNKTHNAASQMKKLIRAYMRADVALLRPTWFTKLEGITAA